MTQPKTADVLVVNQEQALLVFEQARIANIRDIRTVDTDLLLVMRNGQKIVWQGGALSALQNPDLLLVFKDGTLRAELLFKQIEMIELNEPGEPGESRDGSLWAPEPDPSHAVHQAWTPDTAPLHPATAHGWLVL